MKRRLVSAVALVGLALIACSSSTGSATAPGNAPGTDPAQAPVTQTVGSGGGSVSAPGVVLDIPPGALPSDTPITITPGGTVPSDYTGLSQLYTFSPDGTVFLKPVTIAFTLSSAGTTPTVYWSNASGGYDALATTQTATGVSASIEHFSRGFVAEAKKNPPPTDAGTDSSASDSGSDGGSDSGADSGATSAITATVDGVATTFSANASVVLGNGTTTIKADDNATATHWTIQIVMTGVMQEMCLANGNPYINYTHYTNGTSDLLYTSKAQGTCSIILTNNPKVAGDHATGTISGWVGALNLPTGLPPTHTFANGSFDLTL